LIFVLWAVVAGCSSGQIKKQEDPNADFARYTTYAWAPKETQVAESESDVQIKISATQALASMGLIEVPAVGAPALLITYRINSPDLTFFVVDGVTQKVIWTGTVLHPNNFGDAAEDLVHAYKGSRDKSHSASALAEFYLSIPPEFP
jgi:hypothetical protein